MEQLCRDVRGLRIASSFCKHDYRTSSRHSNDRQSSTLQFHSRKQSAVSKWIPGSKNSKRWRSISTLNEKRLRSLPDERPLSTQPDSMAVPKQDRRQPDSSIIVIQHPFLGIQYSVKRAVRQAWLSDWQDVLCQRHDYSVTMSAKTDRSIRISDRNRLRSKSPNLLQ